MNVWAIRPEREGDEAAIAQVIATSFSAQEGSDGREPEIVRRLREEAELEVSYVAVTAAGGVVGHVAFSKVRIDGNPGAWYGLGPVAVLPDWQGRGIGSALVEAGLESLRQADAEGCVVLGDPGYYTRFGFEADTGLTYPRASVPNHFQRLLLRGEVPRGEVSYADAFG
jgi:predicted N-acetyltransferase YhbS